MTGKIRHYYSGQITSVVNVDILRYDGRKWASRVTNSDLNFMIRNFRILHLAGVQLASYRGIYTPRYIHGHEHSSTHRDITRRSPIIEITLRWCTRIEPWKLSAEHLSDRITSANDREARDTLFVVLLSVVSAFIIIPPRAKIMAQINQHTITVWGKQLYLLNSNRD